MLLARKKAIYHLYDTRDARRLVRHRPCAHQHDESLAPLVYARGAAAAVLREAVSNQNGVQAMMGYGYYGGMMGGFGWVWMVLVLAVVITLLVWSMRTGFFSRRDTAESTLLDILRRRYAAGEITAAEFEQAKRAIA
jgi:putative membrane protein